MKFNIACLVICFQWIFSTWRTDHFSILLQYYSICQLRKVMMTPFLIWFFIPICRSITFTEYFHGLTWICKLLYYNENMLPVILTYTNSCIGYNKLQKVIIILICFGKNCCILLWQYIICLPLMFWIFMCLSV